MTTSSMYLNVNFFQHTSCLFPPKFNLFFPINYRKIPKETINPKVINV